MEISPLFKLEMFKHEIIFNVKGRIEVDCGTKEMRDFYKKSFSELLSDGGSFFYTEIPNDTTVIFSSLKDKK